MKETPKYAVLAGFLMLAAVVCILAAIWLGPAVKLVLTAAVLAVLGVIAANL